MSQSDLTQDDRTLFPRQTFRMLANRRGCWAEVSEDTVKTRWSLQDGDGSHLPPEAGILACEIPGYPDAKGLPLLVHWGRAELRPTFHLTTDLSHALALDQRNGIDEVRYHAILNLVMH